MGNYNKMRRLKSAAKRLSLRAAPVVEQVLKRFAPTTYKNCTLAAANCRLQQKILSALYAGIAAGKEPPLSFREAEFQAYSQNGEDGILLYIFSLIGMRARKAVEICAGDGIECNTANLIINHGWQALLVDGNQDNVRLANTFYQLLRDCAVWPTLAHAWVTAENVNSLIATNGFSGEIDLLSLDLDGVDYWVWKAIDIVQPRVVVVEFNAILGPDRAMTVPYSPTFKADFSAYGSEYGGASLAAMVKLGKEKGYRLVGCQTGGVNAFFVREGIGAELLPEASPCDVFDHPRIRFLMEQRLPAIISREWISV